MGHPLSSFDLRQCRLFGCLRKRLDVLMMTHAGTLRFDLVAL
jgi:hypothetical protein